LWRENRKKGLNTPQFEPNIIYVDRNRTTQTHLKERST
jgi:hypothetical protein